MRRGCRHRYCILPPCGLPLGSGRDQALQMDPSLHVIPCHYLAALDQTVWPYVEVPLQLHKTGLLVSCLLGWGIVSPVFLYVQICSDGRRRGF